MGYAHRHFRVPFDAAAAVGLRTFPFRSKDRLKAGLQTAFPRVEARSESRLQAVFCCNGEKFSGSVGIATPVKVTKVPYFRLS